MPRFPERNTITYNIAKKKSNKKFKIKVNPNKKKNFQIYINLNFPIYIF